MKFTPIINGFRFIFILIQIIVGLILLYVLLAIIFTLIPVNRCFKQASDGIDIFVRSNGLHADLVVPVISKQIDWRKSIRPCDFEKFDSNFSYIAFGWGDRGYYIEVSRKSKATFSTGFKALFLPSAPANACGISLL